MKHLLLLSILFVGMKGMGQDTPRVIFQNGWLTKESHGKQINMRNETDTVSVIMQVCDTSYYKGMDSYAYYEMANDSITKTVGHVSGRLVQIWWQFGYAVKRCMTAEEMGSVGQPCITTYDYLDSDKKPLKNIYVWMSNTLK